MSIPDMACRTGSETAGYSITAHDTSHVALRSPASSDHMRQVASDTASHVASPANVPHAATAAGDSLVADTFRLYYRWDGISLDETYLDNEAGIRTLLEKLRTSERIDSISIYSYSSPEGAYAYNAKLSSRRAEAAKKFILDNAPEGLVDADRISVNTVAEHWEGLYGEVEANYFRWDRDWVLKTIAADVSPETKEWRFKNHDNGIAWNLLRRRYMPKLRLAAVISIWTQKTAPASVQRTAGTLPQVAAVPADTLRYHRDYTPECEYQPPVLRKTFAAVKTNLLYDAVTALNVEIEIPIGRRFSVMVEDVFPWWTFGPNRNKYAFQMWEMGIEPRWWFIRNDRRDKLSGHFLGVYGMSAKYDFQWDRKACYQGEYWSAGLTYGYAMPICKWLNMEFSLSVGYLAGPYRHYFPDNDYEVLWRDIYDTGNIHYIGPTKAKISLVVPLSYKYRPKKK